MVAPDPIDQPPDLLRVFMIRGNGMSPPTGRRHEFRRLLDRLGTAHRRTGGAGAAPRHVHGRTGGTQGDGDAAATATSAIFRTGSSFLHDVRLEQVW
ncbi:hypothetical protein Val02_57930 [Virgisporangium aliadipatigenens]|uniref:Uncharacterized protein n=1 Tax=Virgisporangium aliadipatigenens TaxID=741659 RepID=A0A8J3YR18_9ACTN|nr:hypothetical protein Val02_57930 [Virgisporangium aliadipatigenens]